MPRVSLPRRLGSCARRLGVPRELRAHPLPRVRHCRKHRWGSPSAWSLSASTGVPRVLQAHRREGRIGYASHGFSQTWFLCASLTCRVCSKPCPVRCLFHAPLGQVFLFCCIWVPVPAVWACRVSSHLRPHAWSAHRGGRPLARFQPMYSGHAGRP